MVEFLVTRFGLLVRKMSLHQDCITTSRLVVYLMESDVIDFVGERVADLLWVILSNDTLIIPVDFREV